jgi:hypothetical protein
MATYTANPYGTAIAPGSAANGDLITCADNYTLTVQNTDASSHSFTLPVSATIEGRAAVATADTFVVAAGMTVNVRMSYRLYANGVGQCPITYTAVTGMKVSLWAG